MEENPNVHSHLANIGTNYNVIDRVAEAIAEEAEVDLFSLLVVVCSRVQHGTEGGGIAASGEGMHIQQKKRQLPYALSC